MSDHETNVTQVSRLRRIAKWLALSLGALIVLIALLLGAFTLVMTRMPEYRAQVQTWLSKQAKLDIQFAELRAGWRGYGPALVFTQAVVRSADGQRVLATATRGGAGLDLWQALRTGRLVAARFYLQGTEIKMQRRSDGRFEVVGQADWPEFETENAFQLDSLPIGELTIRDVRLSFRDLKTGRGPWALDQVDLDITRNARVFEIKGQAEMSAALGKSLEFSARGEGNLNEVAQLKWRAEVTGTQLDLAGWAQVMPDDWIAPKAGQGSFQFNTEFIGREPQRISGRIDFVDVLMKLPMWATPLPQADPLQVREDDPDAVRVVTSVASNAATGTAATEAIGSEDLRYSNVGLAFTATRSDQGWLTQFQRLQLARADSPWPVSSASLLLKFNDDATSPDNSPRIMQLQASAQLIVLDNLWPLLAYLPESSGNAALRALNATGRLSNLAVRYERDEQQTEPRYGLRMEFAQLGVSPVGGTPGISGLSGVLSATGARGQLQLDGHDAVLSLPRLFRTPLPVDQINGHIQLDAHHAERATAQHRLGGRQ
ncbi:MAG: hypothetical protein QM808_01840 [Steroidobacteraceae bacterium]